MSKIVFKGKILMLGCGSVAQCALPLLFQIIDVPHANVTVLDFVDNRKRVKGELNKGVHYEISRMTKENYVALLEKYLSKGDLLIDLAWNIETLELLEWCRENNVLYINTSVENWDPYIDEVRKDPRAYTLYTRQMQLLDTLKKWGDNNGASAIIDHGANPGLVSHFTKHALIQIAERIIEEKPEDSRRKDLEAALADKKFNKLAELSGVRVIHISERDTQITKIPKRVNEFVNTWSIEGLYEEGMAPAELGWGTHERKLPSNAFEYETGPANQICLTSLGMNTWARSWVPCGEIVGMLVRHGEAYSISERLTVWNGNKAVYRPTVHYVYCPSDSTIVSLHELRMRQYKLQSDQRILSDEITDGRDELGVLLMGHDFRAWWTGSLLDIHESRKLIPGQNATTLQVAIAVISGAAWMIKNPKKGVRLPDDIDHEFILKLAFPYLGPFYSQAVNWGPGDNLDRKFTSWGRAAQRAADDWQFSSFLVG